MSRSQPEPFPIKLVLGGVGVLFLSIVCFFAVDIETVEGNEYGILETWNEGVVDDVKQPRTYWLFPGWSQEMYVYDGSTRIFVMNDEDSGKEFGEGRVADSYEVQSVDNQTMHISMRVPWRLDPSHLVSLHKTVRDNIEEKILRPTLLRTVKDFATAEKAIDVYSGVGLVTLQKAIEAALTDTDGDLAQNGVIVQEFVIEGIKLDPNYIGEITQRQLATQKQLRAVEEEKAAQAEALVAKALAQADLNKQVVEAERDARKQIIAAEANKEQIALAAAAERIKIVEEATGTRDANLLEAEGILAIGTAEAEARQLNLTSWAAPGADNFVRIQVAESLAKAYSGITGFVPEDMNITVLANSFDTAVNAVVAGNMATANTTTGEKR